MIQEHPFITESTHEPDNQVPVDDMYGKGEEATKVISTEVPVGETHPLLLPKPKNYYKKKKKKVLGLFKKWI